MGAMAFWECVREAWLNATQFIRRKPLTVTVAFAILFACNVVSVALGGTHGAVSPYIAAKLLQWIVMLVRLTVMVVLPIQVIRHVMLGEHESQPRAIFGNAFWRYLGLSLAIGIGSIVVGALVVGIGFLLTHSFKKPLGGTVVQLIAWSAIAFCVVSFIGTRFSLLFCHVGIGGPIRWRASWTDTRGHFWRIVFSHVLTLMPLYVVCVALFALIRLALETTGDSTSLYPAAITLSLLSCLGLVLGSTCACWLYRRFARVLAENP